MGEGGMGQVYEGVHNTLDRKVAVKILLPRFAYDARFRERFLREAKAASKVRHPNVVQILDFGDTPNGSVYFAMEYLEGRDLRHLLYETGPLPWPRARNLLLQISSALAAAHERGVIHRDLKPANFFISDARGFEDFVKVLDFGIAKIAADSSSENSVAKSLTGTGQVFGTAKYMAPEQAYGSSDDPRVDVYSVGVVAYEILTGQIPFDGSSAFEIITRHVNEPPRPLRELEPSVPAAVEAVVLHALAKKPERRFASMEDLERALSGIPADVGSRGRGAPLSSMLRRRMEQSRPSAAPQPAAIPFPPTRAQATPKKTVPRFAVERAPRPGATPREEPSAATPPAGSPTPTPLPMVAPSLGARSTPAPISMAGQPTPAPIAGQSTPAPAPISIARQSTPVPGASRPTPAPMPAPYEAFGHSETVVAPAPLGPPSGSQPGPAFPSSPGAITSAPSGPQPGPMTQAAPIPEPTAASPITDSQSMSAPGMLGMGNTTGATMVASVYPGDSGHTMTATPTSPSDTSPSGSFLPPDPTTSGSGQIVAPAGPLPGDSPSGSMSEAAAPAASAAGSSATAPIQQTGDPRAATGPLDGYPGPPAAPETDLHELMPPRSGSRLLVGLLGVVGMVLAFTVIVLAFSGDDEPASKTEAKASALVVPPPAVLPSDEPPRPDEPIAEPTAEPSDPTAAAPDPSAGAAEPSDAEPSDAEPSEPTEPPPDEPEEVDDVKSSGVLPEDPKPAATPKPRAPPTDSQLQSRLARKMKRKCKSLGEGKSVTVDLLVGSNGTVLSKKAKGAAGELQKCLLDEAAKAEFNDGTTRTLSFQVDL
ncbi:MAG: protein kinase [Myxococcales bacterium]|nr:protein kinase [Myxococcales bacterium]